ncbi:MAG TPA: hypothetical protein VK524_18745 [Polyangiaceae bacterium]|nr:hypothetical protein [Polyangiaceae bacterium]
MARFMSCIALASLLGSSAACGVRHTAGPASPPPEVPQPQTEVRGQRGDAPPKLIAPPPAYGNKVVLASARTNAGKRL